VPVCHKIKIFLLLAVEKANLSYYTHIRQKRKGAFAPFLATLLILRFVCLSLCLLLSKKVLVSRDMYRSSCTLDDAYEALHTSHTLKDASLQERGGNGDLPYVHGYVSFVLP